MPGNFYYDQILNFLNIGSSYAIRGFMYLHSGDGNYEAQIINSDASSVIFSQHINGQHGDWVFFSAPFTASSIMQTGYLRFAFTGTQLSWATFDQVEVSDNKDMVSLGAIRLYPEWEMRRYKKRMASEHRCKTGSLFAYTWGNYERFEIPLRHVPAAKAAIVNSWWQSADMLMLKIESGGVWEVNSLACVNKAVPFERLEKGYIDQMQGTLELETF